MDTLFLRAVDKRLEALRISRCKDDSLNAALHQLFEGGYLSPYAHRGAVRAGWTPTTANLDKPVTAREVTDAVGSVVLRMEEKKTAVEHPEALNRRI